MEHLRTSAPCTSAQISPYLTLAYGEVYVGGEPAPVGIVVEAVIPREGWRGASGCSKRATSV